MFAHALVGTLFHAIIVHSLSKENIGVFDVDSSSIFKAQGTDGTLFLPHGSTNSQCHMFLDIEWATETEASVYSSPVLFRVYSDNTKQVVATTIFKHLEIIDHRGHRPPSDWPVAFQNSKFYSSPILYDIDLDGTIEVIATDLDGRIKFVHVGGRHFGEYMKKYTANVPRVQIGRYWYLGPFGDGEKPAQHLPVVRQYETRHHRTHIAKNVSSFFHDADLDPILEEKDAMDGFDPSQIVSPDGEHVFVDPHVLTTPRVRFNLTGNGHDAMVVPISYYFDEEVYQERARILDDAHIVLDRSNFVVGGLAVYDLLTKRWVWTRRLDITTAVAQRQAHIYSSPAVADLDGDGALDIVVGTSLGLLYVLNGADGSLRENFPVEMGGEIQARVTLADLRKHDGGDLEMFVVDSVGHAVCWDHRGEVLWEQDVGGAGTAAATVGDVDGDGKTDIVFGTSSGHVWALNGENGEVLTGFPYKTGGRIVAPVMLTDLHGSAEYTPKADASKGLHLVIPSFDGYVYIIDGKTRCTNKIDFSEHSYAMVLVDDINGDGLLDLLFSSMNGNMYAVNTQSPYHPLKAWSSEHSTYRHGVHGVFIAEETRENTHVVGRYVQIDFEIVDHRADIRKRRYAVSIFTGSTSAPRCIVCGRVFTKPGKFTEHLDLGGVRRRLVVHVTMTNEHGQAFEDSASLLYNIHVFDNKALFLFACALLFQIYFACLFSHINKTEQGFYDGKEE